MPDSSWTETGSSVSLSPTTTTIDPGSSPNNVNYLTNANKITLMGQYSAELAMKTSLDTLASTWSVSSTFYDNAVAGISTALINAGAPSNWATIWPDGTTSGPWPGIQTSLSNLWAQVATQRTALQSVISNAQAAAAYTNAVAVAATDATNKMSTAIAAAAGAPVVVNGLPALPNATYPSTKLVYDTVTKALYMSTGSAWQSSTVAAGNIQGTITDAQLAGLAASKVTGTLSDSQLAAVSAAKVTGTLADSQIAALAASKLTGSMTGATVPTSQLSGQVQASQIQANSIGAGQIAANSITASSLVLANFDNLFPNPTSDQTPPAGGWPTGAYEGVGLSSSGPYTGANCRLIPSGSGAFYFTPNIPVNPGDQFLFQCYAKLSATGSAFISVIFQDGAGVSNLSVLNLAPTTTSYQQYSMACTAPAGAGRMLVYSPGTFSVSLYADNFYLRRMADSSLIVDGSITAGDIAANTITGNNIAAQTITGANIVADTITATQIAASAVTSSELAAGAVVAGKIAAGTIQAGDIAAGTITGDRLAANTITAGQIAANTITAGQIAAGAIGASQIAANSITATSLTICNFDNLFPNPTSDAPAPAGGWPSGAVEAVLLTGGGAYTGTNCRRIGLSSPAAVPYMAFTRAIPVNPGDQFLLQFYGWDQGTPGVGITTGQQVLMVFQNAAQTINESILSVTINSAGYQLYTLTGTAPAGSGIMFLCVGSTIGGDYVYLDNFYLRRMADASLIVDGSITASKIGAGAITADMITAGTLNASNVAVTNLNASNITTGTLSASKVLFADGSALTTASRVLTAMAYQTATATVTGVASPGTLISGLTFSLNAASTSDVYNFFGSISGGQTAGTPGTTCNINLYVDGVYKQAASVSYATLNGTEVSSFLLSLTGLSAGAHTVQFYLQATLSTATFVSYVGSNILCQRIF
jgi:hypothetical protein